MRIVWFSGAAQGDSRATVLGSGLSTAVPRLIAFYVEEHNARLPHAAFEREELISR